MKVDVKRVLDIPAHAKAVRNCARRALIRQASYAMTITKRQLKRNDTISQPGEAPHIHAPGLKRMRYAMHGDYALIYGPIHERPGTMSVPQTLEFGGTRRGRLGKDRDARNAARKQWGRQKFIALDTTHQLPRPFMKPGIRKATLQPRFLQVVKDTYSSKGLVPPGSGGTDS